jgi:hypothetical protein
MNTINKDFTPEDILTGLYKLACVGSARAMNIDLMALEKLSGKSLSMSTIMLLARLGADSEDEVEFVMVCEEALEPNTNTSETKGG